MESCPVCLRSTVSSGTSGNAELVACGTCGVYLFSPLAEFGLSTLTGQQRDALSAYLRSHQTGARVLVDQRNYFQLVKEGSAKYARSGRG